MTKPKPKQVRPAKAKPNVARSLPSRARAGKGGDAAEPAVIEARFDPAGVAARFVPVDALIPYARNSRTHSDEQVAQLAASIAEFGFTSPVLADEKGIVAGHGRVLAARRLYAAGKAISLPNGLELPANTVPVIDVTGWSEAKRRAYVIADNQLALNAGYDYDLLKIEMSELKALDFDLGLLGFEAGALDAIMNPPAAEAEPEGEGDGDPALDEPEAPTVIHCPKCQHQFSILAERKDGKAKRKKAA